MWPFKGRKGYTHTTITNTQAETNIVPAYSKLGGEGIFADLYCLLVSNTSATATIVTIRDDTTGAIRAIIPVPAGDIRGFALDEDSGMEQTAGNKPWTATCSGSVTSIEVTALYKKNS